MFATGASLFLLLIVHSSASPSLTRRIPEPPTITPPPDTPSCGSDCVAHIDSFLRYRWQSYVVNTTITAATLEHIIYPKYGNTTRTKLKVGNIPEGYSVPQRNKAGTIVTTLTIDHGFNKTIETVLAYPTPFSDYPESFWWSGTLSASGSTACRTEPTPVTTFLPPRSGNLNWNRQKKRTHVDPFPVPQNPGSGIDGSNYVLVAEQISPESSLYQSYFTNNTSFSRCRPHNLPKAAAIPPAAPTGALFVTVTTTKTETNCKPDLTCDVRHESTQTGSLIGPTPKSPPNPGSVLPQVIAESLIPHDKAEDSANAQMVGAAPRVHAEPSAASLIVPSSTGNRHQPAAANDIPQPPSAQSMIIVPPQPTTPPNRDSLPIGTITLGGTGIPIALIPRESIDPMGPHLEQTAAILQIGTRTAEMGETVTINDRLVAVTEAPDGAMIAIIAPVNQAEPTSTVLLSHGSPGGLAAAGAVFSAPAATAWPVVAAVTSIPRGPVTVANLELVPNNDGGYSVGGASLSRGGSVTVFGVDPRADFLPSPVLLSLTTDTAGHEVFGVNGQSTTLSSPGFGGTGTSSSLTTSVKKGAASREFKLDARLLLVGCVSSFVLGTIL